MARLAQHSVMGIPMCHCRELDPIFTMASPLTEEEQETTSKKVLVEPADYDKGRVEAEIWKAEQKGTRQGKKRTSKGKGSDPFHDEDEEDVSKKSRDAEEESATSPGRKKKGPKKKIGRKKAAQDVTAPSEKQEVLDAVESILPEGGSTYDKADRYQYVIPVLKTDRQAIESVHTIMAPPITPPPSENPPALSVSVPVITPVELTVPQPAGSQEQEPQLEVEQPVLDGGDTMPKPVAENLSTESTGVSPNHEAGTAGMHRVLPRPEADIGVSFSVDRVPPKLIPLQDIEKQVAMMLAQNQRMAQQDTQCIQKVAQKQAREMVQKEIEDLTAKQAQEMADLERQAQELVQKHVQDMTQKQTRALTKTQVVDSAQKEAEELAVKQAVARKEAQNQSQILVQGEQIGQGQQQMPPGELQVHQLAQQAQLKAKLEEKEAERKVALILAEHKRRAHQQDESPSAKKAWTNLP